MALLGLLALTLGAAAAKDKDGPGRPGKPGEPPRAAQITWSVPRVVQQMAGGTEATVDVTFTSSADLEQVALRVPGGLGRVLKVEPASWDKVAANTPVAVRLTFATPAKLTRGALGGVVQVRAGQKALGQPLPVRAVFRAGDGGGKPGPKPRER
jgi:hypothetical protein